MLTRSQAVPAQRTVNDLVRSQDNSRNGSIQAMVEESAPAPRCASAASSSALLTFLAPPISHPPVSLLGVPFDHVSAADCLRWMDNAIASGRPHYLVTANVDFLVQARSDIELRRILLDAHLVLCDGTPLVWASRLLGNALPERVAGADVVPALIQVAAKKGYRLFFLGATPDACKG